MLDNNQSTNSTNNQINFSFNKAPYIPDQIFEDLPRPLFELCKCIKDRRQRDLFLLSSLTVTSNHLRNIQIPHVDGFYTPSFFFLAIAPPASGKGILNKSIHLMKSLLSWEKEQNQKRKKEYQDLSDSDKKNKEYPLDKSSLIPANTSSRAFYDSLQTNDGKGLIFETELDTMVNASSQEWGNFSEITRKAFHHETISINRKGTNYHISNPDLSICMSGTFDQFIKMFQSPSNGNYSRYAFYTYLPSRKWKTHRPSKKTFELDDLLEESSNKLLRINERLRNRETPLIIELNNEQWDILDEYYEKEMNHLKNLELPRDLDASNARMAVIQIRIASILSILRHYNQFESSLSEKNKLYISVNDFNIAQEICSTLSRHSWTLYKWRFTENKTKDKPERYRNWYNSLPKEFKTNEAINIGIKFDIPDTTIKKWLSDKIFTKIKHGHYRK